MASDPSQAAINDETATAILRQKKRWVQHGREMEGATATSIRAIEDSIVY